MGEFLDGTLPLRRRRAVEAHLRGCAGCRRELESMRQTLALLNDLPRREVSDSFEAALHARLASLQQGDRPSSGRRHPPAWYLRAPWPSELRRLAPVGALALAGAAVVVWNMQPLTHPSVAHQPPAYVSMVVREHQLMITGADVNTTVVRHNLGGDPLGDGDDE